VRRDAFVLDREQHERGEALRIGADTLERDAFAAHLLEHEAPHLLVADTGDEAGLQSQARGADGHVGRRAADRLGEGGDVLEARADLLAVQVDRAAADANDV
jgi:hypothetical protein